MDCREFAELKHGDQKYGDKPYLYHLDLVNQYASKFLSHDKFRELAYLHDVIEDTETTKEEISFYFGKDIADEVELISDCDGDTRAIRKELTYKKFETLQPDIKKDYAVLTIKAIDRFVNMKCSFDQQNIKKMKMYASEYAAFRTVCFRDGVNAKIWSELDSLYEKMKV